MVGPKVHEALDKAGLGGGHPLEARQRLGSEELLLRRQGRLDGLGLCRVGFCRSLGSRHLVHRRCLLLGLRGIGGLTLARSQDAPLFGEHGLERIFGTGQPRPVELRVTRLLQLSLEQAARV